MIRQATAQHAAQLQKCPRCFGRGYLPEKRRPSKRNPSGAGFYARTCPRCGGAGSAPTATAGGPQ